jgi:hypothetical protein
MSYVSLNATQKRSKRTSKMYKLFLLDDLVLSANLMDDSAEKTQSAALLQFSSPCDVR